MAKAKQRENAKEAGFYDGRFRTKVVEDKKKKQELGQIGLLLSIMQIFNLV